MQVVITMNALKKVTRKEILHPSTEIAETVEGANRTKLKYQSTAGIHGTFPLDPFTSVK